MERGLLIGWSCELWCGWSPRLREGLYKAGWSPRLREGLYKAGWSHRLREGLLQSRLVPSLARGALSSQMVPHGQHGRGTRNERSEHALFVRVGPLADGVAGFEGGAEAEDDPVGVGEVGGGLGDIEDLAVGEAGVAEGLDVGFGDGGWGLGELGGVGGHGAFAGGERGFVAGFEGFGEWFAAVGEEAFEAGGVVLEAVGAAVDAADGDADDLAFGSGDGAGSVHGLGVEGAVGFERVGVEGVDFEDLVDGAVGVAEAAVEVGERALCVGFGDGVDVCHGGLWGVFWGSGLGSVRGGRLLQSAAMPTITINGVACEFTKGQMILQVAHANGLDIPSYCYHDGLTIVASCRICLGEAMAPNPRNEGKLEPYMGGKLFPTCQTGAVDGMVVNTDSTKAVANQKAVMEYLLINHPLDCPVCDQSGECSLQDYSFSYGRGASRFEEQKVKQPKKDVGPNILLYSDRCILCTRCVRFTREVTGTSELYVNGRGNKSEIDVFPGVALDNPLASNVIDLCPVGALLDKEFLFAQRVWFLRSTPSIDGITASGDNIWIEHNEGKVYRVKPRENMAINKWWITDEVRYGWKHVHAEHRLRSPMRRKHGALIEDDYKRAYEDTIAGLKKAVAGGKRLALLVSPNLTCEEAYALGTLAKLIDPQAVFGVGPVPMVGEDQTFPPGAAADDAKAFTVRAEKAPNARGVQRVLGAIGQMVLDADAFLARVKEPDIGAVIATGNYREDWATAEVLGAIDRTPGAGGGAGGGESRFVVLLDTHGTPLIDHADVVIPGATWTEKAGTFENAQKVLQAFEQAIPVIELAKTEGQIALDLIAEFHGTPGLADHRASVVIVDEQPGQVPQAVEVVAPRSRLFNAADIRTEMADRYPGLSAFATDVVLPSVDAEKVEGVEMVEL